MRNEGKTRIDATVTAENEWREHVSFAHSSLLAPFHEDRARYLSLPDYPPSLPTDRLMNTKVTDLCNLTLFPGTSSWYMGANIPGKPRESLNYTGGVPRYNRECKEKAENGYEGFTLTAGGAPKGGLMRTRYELEFDMPTLRTITHNMYTCNIETLSDC